MVAAQRGHIAGDAPALVSSRRRVKPLPLVAALVAALVACRRPAASLAYDATVSPRALQPAAPTLDASRDVQHAAQTVPIPVRPGRACITNDECPSGYCFDANLEAQYSRVLHDCPEARAWREGMRRGTCVVPLCTRDEECPRGERCGSVLMSPVPVRMCVRAACRWDADCYAHGRVGQCVPFMAGRSCEHGGWGCVYADDPCSPVEVARRCRPRDGVIHYCIPVGGRFRCVPDPTP